MSGARDATGLAAAERYIEIGQPERALEILSGLDSETAGIPRARVLRAFARYGTADYRETVVTARDALEDDPDSPELLYVLSLAHEQLGELGDAEATVLAALELEPEDGELLCQYASVLMRGGQLDKAERLLDAAAGFDPESPDVLRERLALAYLRSDDREVRELTEQLLAMDPESAQGHRMLGVLAFNRGDAVEAAERMAETVRFDPSNERYAADARQARAMRSPFWWPTRLFTRVGVAQSWVTFVVLAAVLRAAGLTTVATVVGLAWLLLCVYSWVAPPILRRVQGLDR